MENENKIPEDAEHDGQFFNGYKTLLKKFIEEKIELAKLGAVEKVAVSGAALLSIVLILFFSMLFFIFFSIVLALLIAHSTGSYTTGFACMAGLYLLLTVCLIAFRNKMEKPVINLLVKQMLKKED